MLQVNATLAEHEAVIETCLSAIQENFAEIGERLGIIRDQRLYRAYGSFEAYLAERWPKDITSRHAGRLIDAFKVVDVLHSESEVGPMGPTSLPANERQTRGLAPLLNQPQALQAAWKAAQETSKSEQPTAAHVKDVVQYVRQQMAEGMPAQEAIQKVIETARLPTPSEANKLALDTGMAVVGSDGIYHDGRSKDELSAVAENTGQKHDIFRAIEALAKTPLTADAFAAAVPGYQRYRVSDYLGSALGWLTRLEEVWETWNS